MLSKTYNKIDMSLPKYICKTCNYLFYWDWYICSIKEHTNKDGFLTNRPVKKCDKYVLRDKPTNHDDCTAEECVFWCRDCEIDKRHNR